MVTRGSPKPLLRVRVLLPLPRNADSKESAFFLLLLNIPHQSLIHFIKAITIQVNVQVIGDIHISMTQEARKYLHINAFVIAIRGERVPKNVFPSKLYPCFITGFACLVSFFDRPMLPHNFLNMRFTISGVPLIRIYFATVKPPRPNSRPTAAERLCRAVKPLRLLDAIRHSLSCHWFVLSCFSLYPTVISACCGACPISSTLRASGWLRPA